METFVFSLLGVTTAIATCEPVWLQSRKTRRIAAQSNDIVDSSHDTMGRHPICYVYTLMLMSKVELKNLEEPHRLIPKNFVQYNHHAPDFRISSDPPTTH
jgi:hypothetical protein